MLRSMNPSLSYLDCNCFAIRQAARHVSQFYERHMSEVGLTSAQYTLVAAIGRRPGIQMVELAEAMVMDRTTLVRALKPLQRDGVVEASQESPSSRAIGLRLSAKGKETLALAAVQWRAAQKAFEEKVGVERARELREALLKLTSID
jgi:DNA-binding MarR family transcriptional regulator